MLMLSMILPMPNLALFICVLGNSLNIVIDAELIYKYACFFVNRNLRRIEVEIE